MENKLKVLEYPDFNIFFDNNDKLWYVEIKNTNLLFYGKTKNEAINNAINISIDLLRLIKEKKISIDSILTK